MWKIGIRKNIQILHLLLENGKMYQDQISKMTGIKGGELVRRIRDLREEGLIDWKVEDKFGGKKWISLTSGGKEIAKHLIEIEKIMERLEKNE